MRNGRCGAKYVYVVYRERLNHETLTAGMFFFKLNFRDLPVTGFSPGGSSECISLDVF